MCVGTPSPLRGIRSVQLPQRRRSTRTLGLAVPRFCQAINSWRKNADAMANASGSSRGLLAPPGAPEPCEAFLSRPLSCKGWQAVGGGNPNGRQLQG